MRGSHGCVCVHTCAVCYCSNCTVWTQRSQKRSAYRPEIYRPEILVNHPEILVYRPENYRPETSVYRPEIYRPGTSVYRPEIYRPETSVYCPEIYRTSPRDCCSIALKLPFNFVFHSLHVERKKLCDTHYCKNGWLF